MGAAISPDTLQAHRAHITRAEVAASKQPPKEVLPPSDEMVAAVAELKQEAGQVPATLRAPYFVLIHFLENLGSQEVKPADAIRAAVAISQITGRRSEQEFLLAFAEKAFSPGKALDPSRDVTEEPEPVPEELLPLLPEALHG